MTISKFQKNFRLKLMKKRREEKDKIKEFGKSESGQALKKKVAEVHEKAINRINPQDLPF